MNEVVTIETYEHFERLMSTDPEFRKKVQYAIKQVIRQARNAVSKDARGMLNNDPRDSYKAVRSMVYKRIFGGNVNIISKRRAGSVRVGSIKRTLHPSSRGGNRMKRSPRTDQVDSYYGPDRGFILRFNNDGTAERYAGTRDGNMSPARRGQIRARHWFNYSSQSQLNDAAQYLQGLIDTEIQKMNL